MGNKIQYFLTYILAILLLSACGVQHSQITPNLGDMAPNFTLPDINGKPVSLQDFRGKKVVLYLWSIECPWCTNDLRWIDELNRCICEESFTLLTVNNQDSANSISTYLKKSEYSFSVLIDLRWVIDKQYNLGGTSPCTIIIDANGRISNIRFGAFQSKSELKTFIGKGLNAPWDKTPPQISQIGISDISFEPTILNWQTDKETKSNVVLIRGDTEVTGYCLAENWTKYHRLDLADISARRYDKINIISTDYCGNSASALFTFPIDAPKIFNVKINNITCKSAQLNWETDKVATSMATLSTYDDPPITKFSKDTTLTLQHTLIMDGVNPYDWTEQVRTV